MLNINPLIRITLGVLSLTICIVLAGDLLLSVVADEDAAVLEQRKKITKTLSIQFSSLAERDDVETIRKAMMALVERNEDVLSSGLRNADGELVAQAGDHGKHWHPPADGTATLLNTSVPLIVSDGRRWGSVEVSFASLSELGIPFLPTDPLLRFLLFVVAAGSAGYFFFMKRTLRHLDPKAVIPDKVKATLDLLAEGVVLVDQEENIVLANLAFADKVGVDPHKLMGSSLSSFDWRSPGSHETIDEYPWTAAMKEGKPQTDFPMALKSESGQTLVFAANGSPIFDPNFNLRGAMATFNDETALQEANSVLLDMMDKLRKSQEKVNQQNEELKRLATRDPLTGCFNRRAFFERLDTIFTMAKKEGAELSCVMVDVDRFKSINDTHGHAVGDKVIQMIVKLLESKLGNRDNICRYGGEEFCVVLPGTDVERAEELAEQARAAIESYASMGIDTKSDLNVSASLGVAGIKQGSGNAMTLVDQADKALYRAKELGRNRVERWSGSSGGHMAA